MTKITKDFQLKKKSSDCILLDLLLTFSMQDNPPRLLFEDRDSLAHPQRQKLGGTGGAQEFAFLISFQMMEEHY